MRALLEASPRMARLPRVLCFGLATGAPLLPRITPRGRKPRRARPAPMPPEAAAIAGPPKLCKGYPPRFSGVSPWG